MSSSECGYMYIGVVAVFDKVISVFVSYLYNVFVDEYTLTYHPIGVGTINIRYAFGFPNILPVPSGNICYVSGFSHILPLSKLTPEITQTKLTHCSFTKI